ncbi:hypothetical protein TNIN_280921 [Trichonephila inaurata madagascariensis]|uniref:Uncharacterized protein n=1 Tax=Trichonephila inaurata madagascariensis TaxID=2747483 RepID=A0A8X6KH92_9ARAC|nr:hypothetical protein TNIN_280921 [Trichonephila inaurata madagascariensis]
MDAEFVCMADGLINKVALPVKISPLNDINSPKLNEEKPISETAEKPNSSKANILEVSGTKVPEESDLYARCKSKVEELEERLQYLVGIFELLDEM